MWGYGYGGGMTWWMVVVDVLVAALVIAGIVALVGIVTRQFSPRAGSDARQVLEQRFARGEIDEDEFRRRLTALSAHRG